MSVAELLQKAQYLVDGNGHKTAVVFDYLLWDELLTLLEDLEDAEEIRHWRESDEEMIPWEQVKAELRAEGVDV
jgi:hypothetical protein